MIDPLPIQPFTRPARGTVSLPGSKSLTNRALLLSALCEGPVPLSGALFSEDTRVMVEALRRLGFSVKEDAAAAAIEVVGQGGRIPREAAELWLGNAGTAARFLTALCAAAPRGTYRLDGVPQMRKRPMRGLLAALAGQGAEIKWLGEEGFLPFELRAHGLKGGAVKIDASASSQMLSALLMVSVLARSDLKIELAGGIRRSFVEMTRLQMQQFGGPAAGALGAGGPIAVPRGAGRYQAPAGGYRIEADATAASYFSALPLAVGGGVTVPGLRLEAPRLQGDIAFLEVLRRAGVRIEAGPAAEPAVRASREPADARRGLGQDFGEFSDTFLTLAALSPLLEGPTRITGIAHTRRQETDRVAGMAAELRKLGQEVKEEEDALEIHPRPLPRPDRPIEIETYRDHRFAMSFAILGCHDLLGEGRPWLAVRDPACCAKTFPGFFEVLEGLRRSSMAG